MKAYDSPSATISLTKLPLFKRMLRDSHFGSRDSINGFGELSSAIKATNLYFKTPYVPGLSEKHGVASTTTTAGTAANCVDKKKTIVVSPPTKNPTMNSFLQPMGKIGKITSHAVTEVVQKQSKSLETSTPPIKPTPIVTPTKPSPSASLLPETIWRTINEYSALYEGDLKLNYIEGRKVIRCKLLLTEQFYGTLPSSNLCYEILLMTGVTPPPHNHDPSGIPIDRWPKMQTTTLRRLILDDFDKTESTANDGSTKYTLSWSGKLEIPIRSNPSLQLQPPRIRGSPRIASLSGRLTTEGSELTPAPPIQDTAGSLSSTETYDIIMVKKIMDGILDGNHQDVISQPLIYKILPPNFRSKWHLWPNIGVLGCVEDGDWIPEVHRDPLLKFIRYYDIDGTVLMNSDMDELLSYLSDPSLNLPRWVMVKFYRVIQDLLVT